MESRPRTLEKEVFQEGSEADLNIQSIKLFLDDFDRVFYTALSSEAFAYQTEMSVRHKIKKGLKNVILLMGMWEKHADLKRAGFDRECISYLGEKLERIYGHSEDQKVILVRVWGADKKSLSRQSSIKLVYGEWCGLSQSLEETPFTVLQNKEYSVQGITMRGLVVLSDLKKHLDVKTRFPNTVVSKDESVSPICNLYFERSAELIAKIEEVDQSIDFLMWLIIHLEVAKYKGEEVNIRSANAPARGLLQLSPMKMTPKKRKRNIEEEETEEEEKEEGEEENQEVIREEPIPDGEHHMTPRGWRVSLGFISKGRKRYQLNEQEKIDFTAEMGRLCERLSQDKTAPPYFRECPACGTKFKVYDRESRMVYNFKRHVNKFSCTGKLPITYVPPPARPVILQDIERANLLQRLTVEGVPRAHTSQEVDEVPLDCELMENRVHDESQGQDQIEESETMEDERQGVEQIMEVDIPEETQEEEQIMEDNMPDESQGDDRIEAIDRDETRNLLTEGEEEDSLQIKEKITISDEDLLKCLMIGKNGCKPMHEEHFLKLAKRSLIKAEIPESDVELQVHNQRVKEMEENLKIVKQNWDKSDEENINLSQGENDYLYKFKDWMKDQESTKNQYVFYMGKVLCWFKKVHGQSLLLHCPAGVTEHFIDPENPRSKAIKNPEELPMLHRFLLVDDIDNSTQLTESCARMASFALMKFLKYLRWYITEFTIPYQDNWNVWQASLIHNEDKVKNLNAIFEGKYKKGAAHRRNVNVICDEGKHKKMEHIIKDFLENKVLDLAENINILKKRAKDNKFDYPGFNKISNALALAFISVSGNRFEAAYKARLDDWNGLIFDETSRCGIVRVGGLFKQQFKTTSVITVNVPESIVKLIDDFIPLRTTYAGENNPCQNLFIRKISVGFKPIDSKNYTKSVQDYFPGIAAKDLRKFWSTTALNDGNVDMPLVLQHSKGTSETYYDLDKFNRTKKNYNKLIKAANLNDLSKLTIDADASDKRREKHGKDKEKVKERIAIKKIEEQQKKAEPKTILRTAVIRALLENRDSDFTRKFMNRKKGEHVIYAIKRLLSNDQTIFDKFSQIEKFVFPKKNQSPFGAFKTWLTHSLEPYAILIATKWHKAKAEHPRAKGKKQVPVRKMKSTKQSSRKKKRQFLDSSSSSDGDDTLQNRKVWSSGSSDSESLDLNKNDEELYSADEVGLVLSDSYVSPEVNSTSRDAGKRRHNTTGEPQAGCSKDKLDSMGEVGLVGSGSDENPTVNPTSREADLVYPNPSEEPQATSGSDLSKFINNLPSKKYQHMNFDGESASSIASSFLGFPQKSIKFVKKNTNLPVKRSLIRSEIN